MNLLINSEIENTINFEAKNVLNSIIVLTGFCKEKAFCNLAKSVSSDVKTKKIMIRLLLSDIVSGASDLNIYVQAKKYGWDMYIKFDLHAKVYIFDNKTCILGSANLTSKGMNLSNYGNLEAAVRSSIDHSDTARIDHLFIDAIKMTDTIYSKMKINLENIDIKNSEESFFWDNDILRLFQVDLASLSIEDLPAEKIDENIYKSLDDFEKSHIKIKFMSSKSYLWLKNILNESESSEMYFGQLTQALHNILESDMKHYRSEVKERLNILLCWISVLCEDEFTIDIPNYSTRIRLN